MRLRIMGISTNLRKKLPLNPAQCNHGWPPPCVQYVGLRRNQNVGEPTIAIVDTLPYQCIQHQKLANPWRLILPGEIFGQISTKEKYLGRSQKRRNIWAALNKGENTNLQLGQAEVIVEASCAFRSNRNLANRCLSNKLEFSHRKSPQKV